MGFLREVQGPEKICTLSVLANTTIRGGFWVEEIDACPHATLVCRKVITTGLIWRRIEDSEFLGCAVDRFVPSCEDEQGTQKMVERVEVVKPRDQKMSAFVEAEVLNTKRRVKLTSISRTAEFDCMEP